MNAASDVFTVGHQPHPENSFWSVSRESLAAFDRIKQTFIFPENVAILVEGQTPLGVFVLSQGRAKLSTCSAGGRILILRIAEPGDVLGLHAIMTGTPHEMTAETMQPCTLDFVSGKHLWKFLEGHGDVALRLTQMLSHECLKAYGLARTVGLSRSVSGRLARFLLDTVDRGQVTAGSAGAKLVLTHEEMSQVMGTSRETITRLLSEFKKRELVELKGSTLIIRDRPALESLVMGPS